MVEKVPVLTLLAGLAAVIPVSKDGDYEDAHWIATGSIRPALAAKGIHVDIDQLDRVLWYLQEAGQVERRENRWWQPEPKR